MAFQLLLDLQALTRFPSCSPPPPPNQADAWVLIGTAGARTRTPVASSEQKLSPSISPISLAGAKSGEKFGEKLLRAALVRTPEWQASDVSKLSQALGSATVVASKDSSRLRKAHFLELCFYWRYASPYWSLRVRGTQQRAGGAGRRRGTTKASSRALSLYQLPTPALSRPPTGPLEAFRAALLGDVAAFVAADVQFTLFAAVEAEPSAPLTVLVPEMILALMSVSRKRALRMRRDAARLQAAAAEAEASDAAGEASLSEADCAEDHLALLMHILTANEKGASSLSPEARAAMAAPDRAVMADVRVAVMPLFVLVCRAQAELAAMRLAKPHRSVLLHAAADVCSAAAKVNATIVRRMEDRAALVVPRLKQQAQRGGTQLSPYVGLLVEEMARLGCRYEQRGFFDNMLSIARALPTVHAVQVPA